MLRVRLLARLAGGAARTSPRPSRGRASAAEAIAIARAAGRPGNAGLRAGRGLLCTRPTNAR